MRLNFFVYRPDRCQARNINLDLLYTLNDKPFADWLRDEQTVYEYRVKKIKEKIEEIPKQKVFDFWR